MKEDYKKYIISQGGREVGLAFTDIAEYLLTPSEYKEFYEFMLGQTCGVIGSMSIVYVCDYLNFINGKPNLD